MGDGLKHGETFVSFNQRSSGDSGLMSPRMDSFYIVEESYTLPFQINIRLPYHHFKWVKGLMEPLNGLMS